MGLLRRWVARQFTTRVIVLMPVAIAINIVLGYTVQSVLKLPVYVDSIGTILVGCVAGPLPGALTGILSNLIWQYAPGIGPGSQIGPFAITAGVIGLLAGVWGQLGLFRPRRGHALNIVAAVVAVVLIGVMALYTYGRAFESPDQFANATFKDPSVFDQSRLFFLGVMVVFVGLVAWALVLRRDVGAVFAISAGLFTGSSPQSSRHPSTRSSTAASPAAAQTPSWRPSAPAETASTRRRSSRACSPTRSTR
jgi:energy-coupling factor transport system substrate-specific component